MPATHDFLRIPRVTPAARPVAERLADNRDVAIPLTVLAVEEQAARCMGCGVPFCQSGCPLGNAGVDFNTAVAAGDWRRAFESLDATNNFPEFTGRICPAPCEAACVLGAIAEPVAIEAVEGAIAERAFEAGWVVPRAAAPTGRRVAVVGSGPAGLAAADQLAAAGHAVTVYERADRPGGLLRYGVPDFKLEKHLVDRRLAVMEATGVAFVCNVEIGRDVSFADLRAQHDAVVLCTGATRARDLDVPGRRLVGVHPAWDYLWQHNRRVAGAPPPEAPIDARGKHVVVLGGGDTASDCVGTANRQGAASVTTLEILPRPPAARTPDAPWPFWPGTLTTSTSHREGVERRWSVATQAFVGEARVEGVRAVEVELRREADGRTTLAERPGTAHTLPADLVLLAVGFTGPEADHATAQLGLGLDAHGRFRTDDAFATDVEGVFAAGDARRGASLVVWAISEGREAAREVDRYLMGATRLPTKGAGDLPRA
jgi:glutamate synthase (NADPH/NADH) small chain